MKWQYKEMTKDEVEELGKTCPTEEGLTVICTGLNLLGDEEWELICIRPDGTYIFKKPVTISFVEGG